MASIIEEIQATWLYDALKIFCISLKKTVVALGKAYEKPMEMKDPHTMTQPQPPSGGGTTCAGGGIVVLGLAWEREKKKRIML